MVSTVLDQDPRRLFSFIRSSKSAASGNIQRLTVSDKVYTGRRVPDGFYDSLSSLIQPPPECANMCPSFQKKTLKAPDMSAIHDSASFRSCQADYKHVLEICQEGVQIPPISGKDATILLHSLRSEVNDIFSVTAGHYINAGMEGCLLYTSPSPRDS